MNILNQQDVLDEEIKLLNTPGPTLSKFYTFDQQHLLFFEPQPTIKQSIQKTYKFTNLRTTANYPNGVFNILTYVLLSSILEENSQRGLLERLKCTLYSPTINLTRIIGFENKELKSNSIMKKILVQFLQILKYHTGELQTLLNHYPIIVQIFTLLFRTILFSFNFKDAEFYNKQLNSFNTLTSILDFFDVFYQVRNNIIVFQNKGTCVFIDEQTNRYYIGERMTDLSTKTSDLHLDLGDHDDDDDQGAMLKKDHFVFNTPTPCFGEASWDDPAANKHGTKNIHKDSFHQPPTLAKVEEDLQESPSANKLNFQPEIIYYDVDRKDISKKMKSIFQSIPNSPTNQNQLAKNQAYQKVMAQPKKIKNTNTTTTAKNPQKMKCSQIQQNFQYEQYEKKSSKSQNIGKSKTEQNQVLIEADRKSYVPEIKMNKLQSCVVHATIEPDEKRPKTSISNAVDQIKSSKRLEARNIPGYQAKNPNKTFRIPEFLAQRRTSTSPLNSVTTTARKNQQKNKKPRVTFTYSTNNINKKNQTYNSAYSGVETSRINYVSESIISPSGSTVKYQPTNIMKPPILYSSTLGTRPSQWQYFGS